MKIHVLGSGSRGNAIVLESERQRILVDAGFGPRALAGRMRASGIEPESVDTLVITHEHSDHVSGAALSARRWRWSVRATAGTLAGAPARVPHAETVRAGQEIVLDDFSVMLVRTPHDAAEPLALVATCRSSGARVGIAYDLGHATTRFAAHFAELDALLLESNHDVDMLRTGPYPRVVKERVAGANGHLSNDDAAAMAIACAHSGLQHVVLCHLSQQNNTPALALRSMRAALRSTTFRGTVHAASQDTPMSIALGASLRPGQLTLAL